MGSLMGGQVPLLEVRSPVGSLHARPDSSKSCSRLIVTCHCFPAALKWNVIGKVRGLKTAHQGPVTPRGPGSQAELPGMLGAGNIRRILPDAAAILVWHAVFSALWNTFKALKDMPAWPPGFFSQVGQPRFAVFALQRALFVCLVNTPHLSQERWLLTGQVPLHRCRTSCCRPGFSICCPHISEYRKCEAVNVWGKACAASARTEATGVVVRTTVMETEMLFLFIHPHPPAVTVVSGASSLNSGLRVPLENCQIHKPSQLCRMLWGSPRPALFLWKTKAEQKISAMCNL